MKSTLLSLNVLVLLFAVALCSTSNLSAQLSPTYKSNKEIASDYIKKVVNEQQVNLIGELYAPDYVFHATDGRALHLVSDSTMVPFLQYLFKAFPDLHYTISNILSEDNYVSMNLTGTGTHRNEYLGFPATKKKITFREMFFFRIEAGRITEGWEISDMESVKQQLQGK